MTLTHGNEINWNHVFYFSQVAAMGSIKEAAQELGLSPSTLSEQLAQLEKNMQVQLFHRGHRQLSLTPDGGRLFMHAKEMFESGKKFIDAISPLPLGCYPISVGIIPGVATPIATEVLSDFLATYGAVSMKLLNTSHSELETGIAESKYDFGFSDHPPERKDVSYQLIRSSTLKCFVWREKQYQAFSQTLAKFPLLICTSEPGRRSSVERYFHEAGFMPSDVIASDNFISLLEFCKRGLGIGVFAEEVVKKFLAGAEDLLYTPDDSPILQERLYVLWAKDADRTQVVKKLIQMISRWSGVNDITAQMLESFSDIRRGTI